MTTNRRTFIKISGAGIGTTALGGSMISWANGELLNDTISKTQRISRTPTYCEVCFWKCAGWVTKNEDGETIITNRALKHIKAGKGQHLVKLSNDSGDIKVK